MRHVNIPIFIPHLGCPHTCVFCNQCQIAERTKPPSKEETKQIIEMHLASVKPDAHVEIAFFGGSFTAIATSLQEQYLTIAQPYLQRGQIDGIRISTRPDCISTDVLQRLQCFGVTTIELGAQSMQDEVLRRCERGHRAEDTVLAAIKIREAGFQLGLQMMTGLPGDTPEYARDTLERLLALQPHCMRIYPTLVLRGTRLADWWQKGNYQPQTLEETVSLGATLLERLADTSVLLIRLGVASSERMTEKGELLAGPVHPALRELCETERYWRQIEQLAKEKMQEDTVLYLRAPSSQLSWALGHKKENVRRLWERYHLRLQVVTE